MSHSPAIILATDPSRPVDSHNWWMVVVFTHFKSQKRRNGVIRSQWLACLPRTQMYKHLPLFHPSLPQLRLPTCLCPSSTHQMGNKGSKRKCGVWTRLMYRNLFGEMTALYFSGSIILIFSYKFSGLFCTWQAMTVVHERVSSGWKVMAGDVAL